MEQVLQTCLSEDTKQRTWAEAQLKEASTKPGYLVALLQGAVGWSASKPKHPLATLAAVLFKNAIEHHWNSFLPQDKAAVKHHLLAAIASAYSLYPPVAQQLIAGLIKIAWSGAIPHHLDWPTLVPNVAKMVTPQTIDLPLQIMAQLTERYRHEVKSKALWDNLAHTLQHWLPTFEKLFGVSQIHTAPGFCSAINLFYSLIWYVCMCSLIDCLWLQTNLV
jgi:hypothetical protein